MRPIFWRLPPSRSSAAANRRSTIVATGNTAVDELGPAVLPDDEQGRRFADRDRGCELDVGLPSSKARSGRHAGRSPEMT